MVVRSDDGWPLFSEDEADAVKNVLLSNNVNYQQVKNGEGRKFEREFAAYFETDFAIAVANGTVALDLALHGLGIGSRNGGGVNDEVIVTPRSFFASVSCVINAGAIPVFADVDRESGNITPKTVSGKINDNTRAILCVHLAGWPCDMDGFKELVQDRNIKLIEDCAQAHGAKYKGRSVGGLGDVGAWSFCTDKIMTTGGEGGMVTCNDKSLHKRMWSFMNHGKELEPSMEYETHGKFKYVHASVGTNWRMTEMQSAIGRIQLRRMDNWHRQRKENAELLMNKLRQSNLFRVPETPKGFGHAFYKLHVYVNGGEDVRQQVLDEFERLGIPSNTGSGPELYREPAIDDNHQRLPVAKELGDSSIMFVVHPGYDAQRIVDLLDKVSVGG